MPSKDKDPQSDTDELDIRTRVNLRDYPSTALVVIAAVSSGFAWMLYKWLGRENAAKQTTPDDAEREKDV
jgi:hypothetical protein